jgi:hypothetical protein
VVLSDNVPLLCCHAIPVLMCCPCQQWVRFVLWEFSESFWCRFVHHHSLRDVVHVSDDGGIGAGSRLRQDDQVCDFVQKA